MTGVVSDASPVTPQCNKSNQCEQWQVCAVPVFIYPLLENKHTHTHANPLFQMHCR